MRVVFLREEVPGTRGHEPAVDAAALEATIGRLIAQQRRQARLPKGLSPHVLDLGGSVLHPVENSHQAGVDVITPYCPLRDRVPGQLEEAIALVQRQVEPAGQHGEDLPDGTGSRSCSIRL
jgi:hypothetical protein